jgi:hypothetical protein
MSTAKKFSEAAIEILRIANGRHRKVLSVATIARLLEAVNAGDQMAWSSAHLLIDEPALPWGRRDGEVNRYNPAASCYAAGCGNLLMQNNDRLVFRFKSDDISRGLGCQLNGKPTGMTRCRSKTSKTGNGLQRRLHGLAVLIFCHPIEGKILGLIQHHQEFNAGDAAPRK